MSISRSIECHHDIADYYLKSISSNTSGTHIFCCTKEKYMGAVIDSNVSFRNHVSMCTNMVNKLLGIIRRSFCAHFSFSLLYKTIV